MNWFLLALFAAIFSAVSRSMTRYLMRNGGNDKAFTALHNFFAASVALVFIPFFPFTVPPLGWSWVLLAAAVIFYTLADVLIVRALITVESSLNALFIKLITVWVVIGGFFFYHESLSTIKLIGVGLILFGSSVLLIQKKLYILPKGILYTVLATVCLAIAFLCDKTLVTSFSIPLYSIIVFIVPSLLIFLTLKDSVIELRRELSRNSWMLPVAGALFGVYMLFQLFAYQLGEASKVTPVIDASILISVFIGVVFLGERTSLVRKIIGMLLVLAGTVFVGLSS